MAADDLEQEVLRPWVGSAIGDLVLPGAERKAIAPYFGSSRVRVERRKTGWTPRCVYADPPEACQSVRRARKTAWMTVSVAIVSCPPPCISFSTVSSSPTIAT